MALSSGNSHRRRLKHRLPPTSVKCKYCGRWFRNASGRTKHVGVYHPRGELELCQVFQPPGNTSTLLQQAQPVAPEHQSLETGGSHPESESMDIDTADHIDNCMFRFYVRQLH